MTLVDRLDTNNSVCTTPVPHERKDTKKTLEKLSRKRQFETGLNAAEKWPRLKEHRKLLKVKMCTQITKWFFEVVFFLNVALKINKLKTSLNVTNNQQTIM